MVSIRHKGGGGSTSSSSSSSTDGLWYGGWMVQVVVVVPMRVKVSSLITTSITLITWSDRSRSTTCR